MRASIILLAATGLALALIAGLFFAYSCSVIQGLGKLSSADYLKAMQSINREIQNPVFFICFFAPLLLLPMCVYKDFELPAVRNLQIAALAIYAIFVFGVTVFGNVPLNEHLARFDLSAASSDGISAERLRFERIWNILNHVRTLGSIGAFLCFFLSCFCQTTGNR